MKQLTCEVCGGNDLLKQDGVFVCQSCGCKYSANEVKKLMVQISEPVKVEGVSTASEKLQNVKSLINLGKLHEAEVLLETLVAEIPDKPELWLVYSEFSFEKYVQPDNYEKYRQFCTYDGGTRSIYANPPMSLSERCQKCRKEIEKYMANALRIGNSTVSKEDFEIFLFKINKNELEANVSDNEIYNYLYNEPCSYNFDYYHSSGCFPILMYQHNGEGYTTYDGQRYTDDNCALAEQLSEAVKKFIDECNKNMKIYCETFNNKLDTEQWYLFRDKMVAYLCGKDVLTAIKEKFNDKGFYVGKPGQTRPNLGTKWTIAGINGYTLSIKPFYSDAYDDKCITYPTKIQIIGNIEEIIKNAEKENIKINKIKSNDGCYIATSVYGSYDCPEVWTLRRFRDCTLAQTWYGRAFIRIYYAISPTLVKLFGHTSWFQNFWKNKLDRMVCNLKNKGFEDKPYDDRKW